MRPRRGVALVGALAIAGVIALLIGGALAVVAAAQRSSVAGREDAELAASADAAAHSVLSRMNDSTLASLAFGRASEWPVATRSSLPIAARVSATRLADDVLWIVGSATLSGRDAAIRRVNVVARWRTLLPVPASPLMARGSVRLRGGLTVTADTSSDAECSATSFADVTIAPAAAVESADSVRTSVDARAGDSAHFAQTAAQRRRLESSSGAIHVRADTVISNSSFQGVMIADGGVSIVGPFAGSGVIVARGPIVVATDELSFSGALLSFATPSAGQFAIDIGGGVIQFSPCVVSRALRRIAPLRVVRERNWTEIF
jgi:hypothetical protein